MIAVEIDVPIVNHRIDVSSDKLPADVKQARIIVMYEASAAQEPASNIIALARAARASFPNGDPVRLRDEFNAMRAEWDGRAAEK